MSKMLDRRTRLVVSSSGPIPIPVSTKIKFNALEIDCTQLTRYYKLSTLAVFILYSLDSDIEGVCAIPDSFVDQSSQPKFLDGIVGIGYEFTKKYFSIARIG